LAEDRRLWNARKRLLSRKYQHGDWRVRLRRGEHRLATETVKGAASGIISRARAKSRCIKLRQSYGDTTAIALAHLK